MTKIFNSIIISAVLSSSLVYAQSDTSEQENNQSEGSSLSKPEMANLFLRPDQRKILEGIRLGVVEEQEVSEVIFSPIVFVEDAAPETLPDAIQKRTKEYTVDAIIFNRSKGKTSAIIGGSLFDLDQPISELTRSGIAINNKDSKDNKEPNSRFVLEGKDGYSKSGFEIKVGQSLGVDGRVNEKLPVVVRKN